MFKSKYCPVCKSKLETFASITGDLTEQFEKNSFPYSVDDFETLNHAAYLCPECGCSDRDRLIFKAVENIVSKSSQNTGDISILEFAPSVGLGEAIKGLSDRVAYTTADLYMPNVDTKVDICNMKKAYKDESFDVIICSHILEHVKSDTKAMSELKRILKKDGSLLILVPIIDKDVFDEDVNVKDEAERWRRFAQNDHVRLYSKSDFIKRLKESGLQVKQLKPKEVRILSPKKMGINNKSILYICSK